MTRFARAKGSKASNERTPEDSTPWEVMKDQLLQAKKDSEESKKREEAEQKRIENYENFLQERKVQKRKATWCDFPDNEQKKTIASENGQPPAKNKNKKKKNKVANSNAPPEQNNENSNDVEVETTGNASKKSKKKKQKKEKFPSENELQNDSQLSETPQVSITDKQSKKKNKKKQNTSSNQTSSEPQSDDTQKPNLNKQQFNNEKGQKSQPKQKNKKLVDGKPVRRKEIDDRSFQLIVNGREIELVRFDGFPVMKKDAERLADLKNSMIKKGIPKSEVQRTMKLERRRAEKALARIKRDVCYNCRKGGHVLSDCPELKSKIPGSDGADGVCFKCGSTEHRQFECKVQKGDKEFRFATCFICKEPGHIARQCPDNPKGLYPNGGSCKLCGDVTHLRKDCPTVMDKKEGSTMKLQTLDSGENIEDVGLQSNIATPAPTSKKPKKITF